MPPVIKAVDLRKNYGELRAVDGIDFEIERGECFGLLGPNGAGKTTTVKMLTCALPLSGGDITVEGLSVNEDPRGVKYLLGVCPQEINLDPDFSVLKNLIVYSRYFDIPYSEAKKRADGLINRFHLHDKLDRPIEDLSGGLKKRLLMARALINKPKVLVLDEPTTGLDPQSRRQIWEEVRGMKKNGLTTLLTTHYIEEAELLCDRLVIIDSGKIIEHGTPGQLISKHLEGKGNLEDVFLKLTGKNLRDE
ncbi:MAG: ABC transporter [Elusimicrobia bacterium CG_4_10_14_0_2_um_filter_56_8]|nr:MAG: ABC transporter [Elusimicrobia bacterium CG_4_10_14_0_2_um_filter_56_8]